MEWHRIGGLARRMARLVHVLAAVLALGVLSAVAVADTLSDCISGNFQTRINACTAIIKDPSQTQIGHAVAYYNRGAASLANALAVPDPYQGLFTNALADFDEAIRLDLRNAAYYFDRGRAKQGLRLFDAALADFYKARDLDPKTYWAPAYYMIGQVAEAQQDQRWWASAISAYTHAIEAEPKYVAAYLGRGAAYIGSIPVRLDPAIADFSTVIALDPRSVPGYQKRARAYQSKAYHNRHDGFANFAIGNLEFAIADYSKAIEIGPPAADLYSGRGSAYEDAGRREEAIGDYRKALTLGPDNAGEGMIRAALDRLGVMP
jgi:tetratricopeptide (TPR) repeat protein